jgi:hypothetical protein
MALTQRAHLENAMLLVCARCGSSARHKTDDDESRFKKGKTHYFPTTWCNIDAIYMHGYCTIAYWVVIRGLSDEKILKASRLTHVSPRGRQDDSGMLSSVPVRSFCRGSRSCRNLECHVRSFDEWPCVRTERAAALLSFCPFVVVHSHHFDWFATVVVLTLSLSLNIRSISRALVNNHHCFAKDYQIRL